MSDKFKKSLNIYIIHYTKYVERKKYINNELKKLNLDEKNIHFIEKYDANDYDPKINDLFLDNNIKDNYNIAMKKCNWYARKVQLKNLKDSEKSICLKHLEAIKNIKESNNIYGLIIEDDCYFCTDFLNKLETIINNLPNNWDIYWANSTINMSNTKYRNRIIENNNYVLRRKNPATAGAVSYLIKRSSAERLYNDIIKNKISFPIDWEYNWLFKKLKFNTYFNKSKDPLIYCVEFDNNIHKKKANLHTCVMIKI